MYNDINKDSSDCTQYYKKAKTFVDEYSKLLNNNDFDTDDSSHRTLLSSLSTNYNNLKKYCDKNCNGCSSIPSLPTTKTTQVSAHISEATSSSSSITSTLIPGLSTFAIPAFLGIAYKYSLFGIDKLFQRQYIRKKLNQVKKKMKVNI
ncbi:CIR protein PIR protein, fragment [Plasmodium vinckei vinckei]|uniref:CIR protein PIR protein n=1 Tax=Plasmodium vinckei vinckei TaxID=54757 RepID=A0A081I971_PLAVN|nr:CIR protein PIR protein, fragment [Plasmodium vinckei vinckei]KEG00229.1 hypothetical protein YYE_04918 [Plasmodium vinckei vinckei]VEV58763.1 CIR protein PIR protein, fragment [Plasmodium vinckei vinckei]